MEENKVLVDLDTIELRQLLYLSDKTMDRIQKRQEKANLQGTRIRKGGARG